MVLCGACRLACYLGMAKQCATAEIIIYQNDAKLKQLITLCYDCARGSCPWKRRVGGGGAGDRGSKLLDLMTLMNLEKRIITADEAKPRDNRSWRSQKEVEALLLRYSLEVILHLGLVQKHPFLR